MILLEGVDRCGKTSLAEIICEHWFPTYTYRGHTVPPYDPFSYFTNGVGDVPSRMVIDRMHFSEEAYGKTFRDGSKLNSFQWMFIELMLEARGCAVIYLYDQADRISKRSDGDVKSFTEETIRALQKNFFECISKTRLPVVPVNFRDVNVDFHFRFYSLYSKRIHALSRLNDSFQSRYVGSLSPRIVIIDLDKPQIGLKLYRPFFPLDYSVPCNEEILNVLVRKERFGIMSSQDPQIANTIYSVFMPMNVIKVSSDMDLVKSTKGCYYKGSKELIATLEEKCLTRQDSINSAILPSLQSLHL